MFRSGYRLWAWLVDKGLIMEVTIKAACRLFVSEFRSRVLRNITSSFDSLDFCSHRRPDGRSAKHQRSNGDSSAGKSMQSLH